jgi:hypothetical protein
LKKQRRAQKYYLKDFSQRIPEGYADEEVHVEVSDFVERILEDVKNRRENGKSYG